MLKKEFEFILQDELIYSHDGKAGVVAKRLLLRAPNTKLLSLASKLSSIVMASFIKAHENQKQPKKPETQTKSKENTELTDLNGTEVYMIISAHIESNKMQEFIETFKDLILSDNICLIDGKEPLTDNLLDSIDSRETLRLLGDYVANFLLPSDTTSSAKKK